MEIKDKKGNPIEGAYVILFSVEEVEGEEVLTPIRQTLTNDEGVYLFEQVELGDYIVKANKIKLTE